MGKLYDGGLTAIIIFSLFGYGVSVLHRAEADGVVTVEAAKAVVKSDLSKFKPSDKVVYND